LFDNNSILILTDSYCYWAIKINIKYLLINRFDPIYSFYSTFLLLYMQI